MTLDPINKPVEDVVHVDDSSPAASPKDRKDARVAAIEAERERELNELATVLSTDEGRAVVLRILKHCQPYRPTVISTDVEQYLQAEGRRSVSHWLIHEMGCVGPDVYPQLLMFNARRAKERTEFEAGVEGANRRKSPR